MRWIAGCLWLLAACEPQPIYVLRVPYSTLPRNTTAFDCDAAAGFRSEWRQPIGTTGRIRGRMYFVLVRGSSALANVLVRGPNQHEVVSLHFSVDSDHEHIQPSVRTYDASGKLLTQPLRVHSIKGSEFVMEWEPNRVRVRLEAHAPWLEVPVSFVPDQVVLGCSDGNAVFPTFHVDA